MSLADIRADLARTLAAEFDVVSILAVGEFDTARINPPCVLVTPGAPYLSDDSTGVELVRVNAYIVERNGEPSAVMDAIDGHLDTMRRCLQTAQRAFVLEAVTVSNYPLGPDGMALPAALAEVTTMRNYR